MLSNMLSVDVEEWYHVRSFQDVLPREVYPELEKRIDFSFNKVLSILHETNCRATLFFLGDVAKKHPQLVKRAVEAGHEIASHGMSHKALDKLTPKEFETEVRESREILSSLSGQAVIGYRAPNWSLHPWRHQWAIELLRKAGYIYDSSFLSIGFAKRYDVQGSKPLYLKDSFVEVPLTSIPLWRFSVPFAGGVFLRSYPVSWTQFALKWLNRRKMPGMIYFHPWEIDHAHPRIKAGLRARIIHYSGLYRFEKKLHLILRSFPFTPIRTFVKKNVITFL